MATEHIDILVERFWEGSCTEVEEAEIKLLLQDPDMASAYPDLATYLDFANAEEPTVSLDSTFDADLREKLRTGLRPASSQRVWWSIAAGIALLLGLYGGMKMMNPIDDSSESSDKLVMAEDTFENPEEAYEEVKKALALLGGKMNDGLAHTSGLVQFDIATKHVVKTD